MSNQVDRFFHEGVECGLLCAEGTNPPWAKRFYFSLNAIGPIYTPADPDKILTLLRLAEKYANHPRVGIHTAMLAFWVWRHELEQDGLLWHRPIPNRPALSSVSLRDWLAEQGYPYE